MNCMRTMLAGLALVACLTVHAGAQAPPAPGLEHKLLAETVGTWDCTITMAGAPEPSKGTSTSKMAVGGMWLETDFSGEMAGMKYSGKGLDSYDATKKKYIGVWADSFSGSPMIMEGDYDKETKTITMTGKGPDMTGNVVTFKGVTTHKDKDHHSFTMSTVGEDGEETPMMTIEYVRKK
jgi:hypothetical protein